MKDKLIENKWRYEAKEEGFCPGGATLHSMMTPHGPDAKCFQDWTDMKLGPIKVRELLNHKLPLDILFKGGWRYTSFHVWIFTSVGSHKGKGFQTNQTPRIIIVVGWGDLQ